MTGLGEIQGGHVSPAPSQSKPSRYADNPFETAPEVPMEAAADHVAALLDALRAWASLVRGRARDRPHARSASGHWSRPCRGTYRDANGKKPFAVSLGRATGRSPLSPDRRGAARGAGLQADRLRRLRRDRRGAGVPRARAARPGQRRAARGQRRPAARRPAQEHEGVPDLPLFAAPEARVHNGTDGKVAVELLGMDSFDAATGEVVSRSQNEIAAWFLDHDYDGSVFHVNQAFFTRSNAWEALGKALRDTIDQDVVEAMHSFVCLPFEPGPTRKAAIRVVDDAGQTSEAILDLDA